MAVYVPLTEDDVSTFLNNYSCGALTALTPIQKGVSNTNYFVETTEGKFILTLFEERRTRTEDLPFIFAWSTHLNKNGISSPTAINDKDGNSIKALKGKAAVLIEFLQGEDLPRGYTKAEHCRKMGAFTAKLHLVASKDFEGSRENDWPLGRAENILTAHKVNINKYNSNLYDSIKSELNVQNSHEVTDLPCGVVHTDLFPDNIFFDENGDISAVIDPYFACTHAFVYDLAIVVNAWCFDEEGTFSQILFDALIKSYQDARPLSELEIEHFQIMLRRAALRFLMSRLEEKLTFDPQTTKMTPHDPQEYIDRLIFHQNHDIMRT